MSEWTKPASTSSGIASKIARHPPHVQVGIAAYRAALNQREDWHDAVAVAIKAAIAELRRIAKDSEQ